MRKDELMNGDVVITRDGYLGVVIRSDGEDYIMYQWDGWDDMECFDDDMTDLYKDDGEECDMDIMEVYRRVAFSELDDDYGNVPAVWCRDPEWERPSKEEREARKAAMEEAQARKEEEWRRKREEMKKNLLAIVTQHFYGNRTFTEITREEVKSFLRGFVSASDPFVHELETVDLRTIPVPGAEHIVIVYDRYQEDEYVNVEFPEYYAEYGAEYREHWGKELTMKASCEIPQLGITLYTRCFACRIDAEGVFQSLEEEDVEKFIDFFTA